MSALLDSSVVLASLAPEEPHHRACDRIVAEGEHRVYVHAFAEVFAVLTGGRMGRRVPSAVATKLLSESVAPYVQTVILSGREVLNALSECESRGVRGGAIYDFLHLAAARKARVDRVITLDVEHFRALTRPGDPRIEGAG